ncbi:alpha/beta-hydrolase [Mollisia scopiformis]|uniref:Alpha/beta-hydrolase n=1 Tax=Mollisia scopiformis TaxID=149040 RepID=A0A194XU01_MOLSC|nr:alpha/beta-hydrolase [Mollisia scopiformis]KUJ23514.1 alpha/beta-hydrolase [Mollisia scopiformis]
MFGSPPAPTTVSLVLFGFKIVLAAISRLLTAPLRWLHWNGAPVLYRDIFFAAIRAMLSNFTITVSRYLGMTTTQVYENFCKEVHQEPKTINLTENDVTAHWMGKPDATRVILYLHGGGYTQSCSPQHLEYLHRLVTDLNTSDSTTSVSILLLAYTLAPEAQFPTQLRQASAVLSYLLNEGKSPSDILIAGDSAGGGLALSLLSHLLHPHLDIPKIQLLEPLRGAFLYSPWVSFDTTHDSFERNAQKDVLVPNMLRKWGGMYLGTVDGETDPGITTGGNNYSEPLLSNASWWRGMNNVVRDIWIFAGNDEVFADSLHAFGVKLRDGWKDGGGAEENVVLEFGEDEAHIGPILDVMLQYKEKSGTQLGLEKWLKECVA